MPPLALASLLQQALPWLSADGRAVMNTLVCNNGRVGSAQALCDRLGLRSRFQLNRLLRREGLPPYEELAGWVSVLYWMVRDEAAHGHAALRSLAPQTRIEIASAYRLVRRVTGHCWKELRRAGTPEVLRWFQYRTHPPRPIRQSLCSRPSVRVGGSPAPVTDVPAAANPQSQPSRVVLPGGPYGIAVRGRDLAYITRGQAASIERFDLATSRLTGSTFIGCTPSCVTFDPSGARAYVSVHYLDQIAVMDATRHVLIQTWPVRGDPVPLLLSQNGRTLFVTTNTDQLFGLAATNGRVLGSISLPATSHHLAPHPAGDRLYVATRTGGSVLEVDVSRYRVLRSFALGGWPQGLAVSPDGTMLYVANEHHGIDVIGLGNGKCIARIDCDTGSVALAMSPDQRFLYAGYPRRGKFALIDIPSLKQRGAIETGGRPAQIAFDGNGRVILANEAGWLDILPVGGLQLARSQPLD
jgi:DNA-binding beta-propeller fold protein YncE